MFSVCVSRGQLCISSSLGEIREGMSYVVFEGLARLCGISLIHPKCLKNGVLGRSRPLSNRKAPSRESARLDGNQEEKEENRLDIKSQ